MQQEFTDYYAGKQAKKQEKLAHKRPRKHLDHADTRITGRNSSGRNELGMQAGAKAGMNQPAVHPFDGIHKGRNPAWLEVTLV